MVADAFRPVQFVDERNLAATQFFDILLYRLPLPATNNYKLEIEGETRNFDYERDDMASYGYQKQEFNEDGELQDAYDEVDGEDEYDDGDFADSMSYVDDFDEDNE